LNFGSNLLTIVASSPNCDSTLSVEKTIVIERIKKPVIMYEEGSNLLVNQTGEEGLWYLDGELFSSEPSSSIEPDPYMGGVYTIVVSNTQCSKTSNEYLITDIDEFNSEPAISIWPNPAADLINVNLDSRNMWQDSIIEITDITGSVYLRKNIQSLNCKIDLKGYKSGIYIVKVYSKEASRQLRFIKL
jgi:hypothetical protein